MKKDKFTRITSWIAIVASLAALIIVLSERYPRTDLDFDYMGIIIGVLSLLVTILIGWQVADRIILERRIKSLLESGVNSAKRELEDGVNMSMLTIYSTSAICYLNAKDWFKLIVVQRNMIDPTIELHDKAIADLISDWTLSLAEQWSSFNKTEKETFMSYLEKFKELSKLTDKAIDTYTKIYCSLKSSL